MPGPHSISGQTFRHCVHIGFCFRDINSIILFLKGGRIIWIVNHSGIIAADYFFIVDRRIDLEFILPYGTLRIRRNNLTQSGTPDRQSNTTREGFCQKRATIDSHNTSIVPVD
jgi:hypothetical protein